MNSDYRDNDGNLIDAPKLLPCPFCSSDPELTFIGNSRTKSRIVKIRCSNVRCRTKQETGAIRKGNTWLVVTAINKWNKRST